jgi:hypothetical protein
MSFAFSKLISLLIIFSSARTVVVSEPELATLDVLLAFIHLITLTTICNELIKTLIPKASSIIIIAPEDSISEEFLKGDKYFAQKER